MHIKRSIFNKLFDDLSDKRASILMGARQVGKTYLLKKLQRRARAEGLRTTFFDLEQPATLAQFNVLPQEVVDLLTRSGDVVFIDEFHYLKNASHIFKAIYDSSRNVKIYASGSSSIEMHRHIKESLAGRKFIYHIFPCSYSEIAQVVKKDTLAYYSMFGGLPGLIHTDDAEKRKLMLGDILQSYILKDIKSLIKEENIRAFNNLLYLLAQNQGSVVSTASLSREVGLTAKTIESHLDILEQTFVNFSLHSFSRNFGNELRKSRKYYLYDLGVRNVLLKNFSRLNRRDDAGAILESFVFLELQKKISLDSEVRFWRLKDGSEVDFVWIKNQVPYPIEVKKKCEIGEIPKGLESFISRYPDSGIAFVASMDAEGEFRYKDTKVIYIKLANVSSIPEMTSRYS